MSLTRRRQVNSCDELIATELIFENLLTTLEPAEAMAILSMLVFEESSSTEPDLNAALLDAKKKVENIVSGRRRASLFAATTLTVAREQARNLGRVQVDAGLDMTVNDYVKNRLKVSFLPACCFFLFAALRVRV